jgi:hypothetical protein
VYLANLNPETNPLLRKSAEELRETAEAHRVMVGTNLGALVDYAPPLIETAVERLNNALEEMRLFLLRRASALERAPGGREQLV